METEVTPPGSVSEWLRDGEPRSFTPPRIAVLVVHGMGQQNRLDTLSSVAERLAHPEDLAPVTTSGQPLTITQAGTSRAWSRDGLSAEFVPFEVRPKGDNTPAGRVDCYETYWAPLTAGIPTLRDVANFLRRAGTENLLGRRYTRMIYGKAETFDIPVWTALHLLIALILIVSLGLLNATMAIVGWASRSAVRVQDAPTTAVVLWTLVAVVTFAVPLILTINLRAVRRAAARRSGGHTAQNAATPAPGGTGEDMTDDRARPAHTAERGTSPAESPGLIDNVDRVLRWLTLILMPVALTVLAAASSIAVYTASKATPCPRDAGPFCDSVLFYHLTLPPHVIIREALIACAGLAVVIAVIASLVELLAHRVPSLAVTAPAERRKRSFSITRGLTIALFVALVGVGYLAYTLARMPHTPPAVMAGDTWLRWQVFSVWAVLASLAFFVRGFLIEYAGDVAVYVSSHRLDRFHEVRSRIRESVDRTVEMLYSMRAGDGFAYDHVIVVGHSLGSLIAFDALNRLIAKDQATAPGPKRLNVHTRTPLLLTFGSPLDKISFLFSRQVQRGPTRMALSATTQPMLLSDDLRPAKWVNVWSPWDIVSGPLEYFDPSDQTSQKHPGTRIKNIVDTKALTPLAAHVEYWQTATVFEELLSEIDRLIHPVPRASAAAAPSSDQHEDAHIGTPLTGEQLPGADPDLPPHHDPPVTSD